jgi:hypothetical protein
MLLQIHQLLGHSAKQVCDKQLCWNIEKFQIEFLKYKLGIIVKSTNLTQKKKEKL